MTKAGPKAEIAAASICRVDLLGVAPASRRGYGCRCPPEESREIPADR